MSIEPLPLSAPCPRLGFEAHFRLADHLDPRADVALMRDFMDVLWSSGLHCLGRGTTSWIVTVVRRGGQADDQDRAMIRDWAATRPEIIDVRFGELVDLDDGEFGN